MLKKDKKTREFIYYVSGMHCASCEIMIEKQILEITGIESVEASTSRGEVLVEYEGQRPTLKELNELFKKEGYVFYDKRQENYKKTKNNHGADLLIILTTSFFIIGAFIILNRLGLVSWLNVNTFSSLPVFFVFGLLAGISSCAALVGGLVLSMSKQWLDLFSKSNSFGKRIQPHLLF